MNMYIVSSFVAFVICELLAGFVFFKNPKNRVNISFAVETFFIGIWTLFPLATGLSPSGEQALLFTRLVYVAAILVPPAFLYFVFNLIDICNIQKERHKLQIILLISFVFLMLSFNHLFIQGVEPQGETFAIVPGILYHLFFLFFAMTILYGYLRIFLKYKEVTGFKRNRLLYVLIAFVIAGIAGFIHFLTAYGVKEVYPHDFLVILFTAIVAYAIVKYRAIEVNIAFKRTMVYSLSAGLLTGLFVVLVISITDLFSTFTEVNSFKISIFAALVIALLFDPLRNRIQRIVDRYFYKKSYDYYATIRKVSRNLASKFDLIKIYDFIGDMLFSSLNLKSIYILNVTAGDFVAVYSRSEKNTRPAAEAAPDNKREIRIHRNDDIVKYFQSTDDILIKEELPLMKGNIPRGTIEKIRAELRIFEGEAVVPVFVDNRLTMILILGGKMSGDMFTNEDVNLLNTISAQTAIAIKNARLYKDKIRSERLASIGMMSATFAHEIRNPLTSLKTFAQLIPEKYNDAEFRDKFSKIVLGEIERVNRLIEDLLDFSNDKKTPGVNIFDIKGLLDELVDYVRDKLEIEKRNIVVEKTYDENIVQLSGNEDRLKHAFINIMNNGCQAMNGNGVLKVRISKSDRHVDVDITDTGEGISPDSMDRIFDPFVTTKEMGIGLGLAISKKIVEDHGGRIRVKSTLKKGTTFTVSLPVDKNSNGEMKDINPRTNMEIA